MKIFCALIDLEQKQVQPRKIAEKKSPRSSREELPRGAGVAPARGLAQHVGERAHGLDRREDGENPPRSYFEFAEISSVPYTETSDGLNSPSAGLRDDGHHPQVGLLAHTCASRPAYEHCWRNAGAASIRHDDHLHSLITL